MKSNSPIIDKLAEIYEWLDLQSQQYSGSDKTCVACGKCCDFENFNHQLFVTTPEMMYLATKLGRNNIRPMRGQICPYNIGGKCTIYENRFAGCRIFYCWADQDFQSGVSESALKKIKSLCKEFDVPYRYADLKTSLNEYSR